LPSLFSHKDLKACSTQSRQVDDMGNRALSFILILLMGCASTKTKSSKESTLEAASANTLGPQTLPFGLKNWTDRGNNRRPWVSSDGQSLFFVSSERGHPYFQIYNLDLRSGSSKRITFQNGDCLQGASVPGTSQIIYSSTTDELKEKAFMDTWAANYLNPSPQNTRAPHIDDTDKPAELYLSRIDGSQIRRLTKSPGFDGEVSVNKNGRTAVFSSRRSGRFQLFKLHLSLTAIEPLFAGSFDDREPQFSPDGKQLVWVRRERKEDGSLGPAHIYRADWPKGVPEKITSREANHLSPSWSPDSKSLVFSSDRGSIGQYDVYLWSKESNCLRRLTEAQQSLDPVFHSDGQFVYFSSNRSGLFQIYSLSIPLQSERPSCLDPGI
jgi:TolB protein